MAILDSYSPTTNDLALTRQVPVANTRRVFDPQSFTSIPNVPVFAEHETTCTAGKYAGRKLTFGYNELLAVCQRCNRRITETGDYATIVIGHTPPRDLIWKGEAKSPELIGFCGPFRMGQIALADGRLRWSILADFHVFKEDEKKLRKYPRRSAELWLEERYDDMFLDPIALLSSEAPRLDMGLLYSRFESGRNVEIYAAAAGPSASSVFIPAPAKPAKNYQGEDTMPFSPEDVQQIVSAIMQTEPMQFVVSLMQQQGDPAGQPPGPPPGPDAGAAPGGPPPGPGAPPPEPQPMAGSDPAGAPPAMPGAPGAGPMMPPQPGAMPGQPPKQYAGDDDDDEEYDDEDDDTPPMPKPKKKKPAAEEPEQYSLQSAHKRIYSLEQQLAVERYARENVERRSFFVAKQAEGYDVNPDDEMAICASNVMPREQWEKYSKHFEKTRSHSPLDFSLPAGQLPRSGDKVRTVNGRPEVAEYSLEASDRARQVCEAAIARGETVDYESVLRQIVAGQ